MPSPVLRLLRNRRVLIAIAGIVLVVVVVIAFVLLHSPGNVSHPNLSFTTPTTTTSKAPTKPAKKKVVAPPFLWPRYGYDAARTRNFNPGNRLAPPLRVGWRFNDGALLEFPPVIDGTRLFMLDDDGSARSIDTVNGHVLWDHKLGDLAAASPAVDARQGLVIFVLLSVDSHSPGDGEVIAVSMSTGRRKWSHPLPAGSESSPLVWNTTVYFGDQSGTVYSMNAGTGHVNWEYHASGSVKGGLSLSGGILYFGDYAGRAYALNARTGHQVWAVGTSGTSFGFGSGNFYSTPAIAFGRVYLGNTDGYVYSFAAKTGQLAWSTGTGAYVYASPAVADLKGIGPTVYIGSYTGEFIAFNAQSGGIRWEHPSGGRISGSATIVGDDLYYSDLGTKTTIGLNAVTGRQVFSFPDGAFNPVIADYGAIYLDGYGELYQMLPQRAPARAATPPPARRSSRHPAKPAPKRAKAKQRRAKKKR